MPIQVFEETNFDPELAKETEEFFGEVGAPSLFVAAKKIEEAQASGNSIPEPDPFIPTADFQDFPSVADQFTLGPLYYQLGPVETDVFDLSKTDQKTAYNRLQAMAVPETSPGIIVIADRVDFSPSTCSYIVLFRYRRVRYRKLLEKK
jgi:hypothetical protein